MKLFNLLTISSMKSLFLFALVLFTIVCSCSKNDTVNSFTHHYNATMRVTVSQLIFNNGNYTDSSLAGAKVDVYENKDDRDNVLPPDYSKITGSNGMVEFDNLDTTYYYLRITNTQTQKVIKDETSTPEGKISLVQIIFQ